MSKDIKVEDLSPAAKAELDTLCAKLKKGDNTGQTMSRKDQMFYLERKMTDQIYSHIEQCEEDRLQELWNGKYNGETPNHQNMFIQLEQFIDKCDKKQLAKFHQECIGETDLTEGFLSIIAAKEIDLSR